jgi:cytochrome c oxidase cbb3-type subunit III
VGIAIEGLVCPMNCRHEAGRRLPECLCLCLLLALFPSCARAQNPVPGPEDAVENVRSASGQYAPADIAYGAQVFKTECIACHGENGDAVAGLNFRAGQFKRVFTDADLRKIITTGIPGTAMPAWHLDAAELAGVIAYLRNMSTFDSSAVPVGDPAHGKTIFEGTGQCASCHRVNGKGPRVAPDLSDIAALRTPDFLERTLLDPNALMLPANRTVRAVTRDGKVITGRRLNEDTYTIQLIDQQEHLISLEKADLRDYTFIQRSGMPSYKDTLSSKDVADLVAYLLSLKGSP